MPAPPKTPRSPMTPNTSQAMKTNNVLLDGSLSSGRKSKIPIELWLRGIALLGVLLLAVLVVMHGSRNLSLKDDVIPKISNPVNFFIFNAVVTSFAVIPGAASATCVAAGVIFGAGFGTILMKAGGSKFSIKRSSETRGKSFYFYVSRRFRRIR